MDKGTGGGNDYTAPNGGGGRHLEGTGLDINGVTIEYTSYGMSDGVINIGSYYPVK